MLPPVTIPMRQALNSPISQMRNQATEQWHGWAKMTWLVTVGWTWPGKSGIKGHALHSTSSQVHFEAFFSPKENKCFTHWNTITGFRAILRQSCIVKRALVIKKINRKKYLIVQWFEESFKRTDKVNPKTKELITVALTLSTHQAPSTRHWASLVAQWVKNPPAMQETPVRFLGQKDLLEKDKLPNPIFWSGEFHGLYSPWGRKESDTTERLSLSLECFIYHFPFTFHNGLWDPVCYPYFTDKEAKTQLG